jgi:hypothetical protein
MDVKQQAIWQIYQQVGAPEWVSANVDGLVGVMIDLSWLPEGPVTLVIPDLGEMADHDRVDFLRVLRNITTRTWDSARPVHWVVEC